MNTTTTKGLLPPTHRGAAGEIETFAMANCLMLLSSQNAAVSSVAGVNGNSDPEVVVDGRVYACQTCDRKFSSFQALGGHRASHKKIVKTANSEVSDEVVLPVKEKVHKCAVCGAVYPSGQALGGHMRRHRDSSTGGGGNVGSAAAVSSVTTEGSSGHSDGNDNDDQRKRKIDDGVVSEVPVLKKSSSCKRVRLDLDLNLRLWRNEDAEDEHVVPQYDNIEEGEIVEQQEDDKDFLKLELRQPINW